MPAWLLQLLPRVPEVVWPLAQTVVTFALAVLSVLNPRGFLRRAGWWVALTVLFALGVAIAWGADSARRRAASELNDSLNTLQTKLDKTGDALKQQGDALAVL